MRTKEMKSMTADAVTVAHDAYETACVDLRAEQAPYQDLGFKLARALEGAGAKGLDFLVRYRFEAGLGERRIAIEEGEYRVRQTRFDWTYARDAHAVASGDADARRIASLVADMMALATRSQASGDLPGLLRAVEVVAANYEASYSSFAARCQAADEPAPLRIDPPRVWAVSLELARCETAGVPATATGIFRAVYGPVSVLPPPGMTADEAAALFTVPQPPKPATTRIQHLRRELDELHGRAYDEHARREAEAADQAREKRAAESAVRHAREREQCAAAQRAKEIEKLAAAARERRAKIAEFAAARSRPS
jgi:hypothetical protein